MKLLALDIGGSSVKYGLVDPLDPEPAVYGGDFHGQSDAWVQATFTCGVPEV